MALLADVSNGLVGAILLKIVYYGFEFQWPGTYRNLADTFGLRVTSRLWRLISFRAGPVFMAGILVWTIAHRLHGTGWLAVLTMSALHIASTNGRAFVGSFVPGRPVATINYGSYHVLAGFVAAAAGVGSSFVAPFAKDYVPSRQSLVDGFWTALLVATVAGFVLRLVGTDTPDRDPNSVTYWVTRAVRDASIDSFDMLFSTASAERADPLLVKAFAVAEVLQRPKWFRRTERVVGRVRHRGSYGIMQITASHPISDEESVRRFSERIAGRSFFTLSESTYATTAANQIWGVSGRHNGDRTFYDVVERLYEYLLYSTNWVQQDPNGGAIGIVELRRYPTEWGIRVVTSCSHIALSAPDGGYQDAVVRPESTSNDSWWSFEAKCPIEVENIQIYEVGKTQAAIVPLRITDL